MESSFWSAYTVAASGNRQQALADTTRHFATMAASYPTNRRQRLDSWKEIATFFGRDERTVNRWEKERGLPVHRVPGSKGRVYAYSDELTAWLEGTGAEETRPPESGSDRKESAELAQFGIVAPDANTVRQKSSLSLSGVAARVLPLLIVGSLIAFFSVGQRTQNFTALAGRHAPNAEARDFYLKGRYYWDRRTPKDLNRAVDYFTQAIVKDPTDAQAYVGLADCYNLLREFGTMPPDEAYPRALAAAQRAVEFDDTSAEAHNSLAFVTFWWSWRAATAEREFKRALELDPKLVRGHHWYATYLMGLHRYRQALDQMEQAQRLDPSSTAILADKGFLLWCAGREKEGFALLKQLEASEPMLASTHSYLGRAFWERQDYPNTLMEWRRAAELRHDQAGLAMAAARERGFADGGLRGLLEAQLPLQREAVERGSGSAYDLAATYAALGQKQEALAYLQTAFEHREAGLLADAPPIPSLQGDPEYQKLKAQVQLRLAQ